MFRNNMKPALIMNVKTILLSPFAFYPTADLHQLLCPQAVVALEIHMGWAGFWECNNLKH